jgi:hypothetical protein
MDDLLVTAVEVRADVACLGRSEAAIAQGGLVVRDIICVTISSHRAPRCDAINVSDLDLDPTGAYRARQLAQGSSSPVFPPAGPETL